MTVHNPIKKSGGAELPAGTNQFFLTSVEPGERHVTKWSEVNGKKVGTKTDEKEEVVKFKFEMEHPELGEATAQASVRPFNAKNGNLVKLLNTMAPGELTEEIRVDIDKLWDFAQSLVNRAFFLSTTPKDGYNNIKALVPVPAQAPASKARPRVKEAVKAATPEPAPVEDSVFEDDDIPF